MPVDTSIYSNLLRPAPTMEELDQQNLIGQQTKQNLLMGQQKLDEYGRGLKQDADQRAAVSQFGTDQTANYNRLLQTGNLAAAQSYQKSIQDATKAQADVGKTAAETSKYQADTQGLLQKQKQERVAYHLQQLPAVSTVEDAAAWLKDGVASGELPADKAQQVLAGLQANPASIGQWKQRAQLGGVELLKQFELQTPVIATRNTGGATDTTSVNPLTGEFKVLGSTRNTQSPDSVASQATQIRGQNMADARSRETASASMSKPFEVTGPDGSPILVQQDKSGAITPVAGYSPKAAKESAVPASVNKSYIENRQSSTNLGRALSLVDSNPDAFGAKNFVPGVSRLDAKGTEARAAVANVGSLLIHDRSGAAVTVAEMPRLTPFIPAATDPPETVKTKLRQLKTAIEESGDLMAEAYPALSKRASAKGAAPSGSAAKPGARPPLSSFGGN